MQTSIILPTHVRVGAFINAPSKFYLRNQCTAHVWWHVYEVCYILVLKYCIGFNIGRFNEGIVIVGYIVKIVR